MIEIVITRSVSEANLLVPHTKELDFHGNQRQDYSKTWFWVFDKGEFKSGSSGWNALEHTLEMHPHARLFNFTSYCFNSTL